MYHCLYQVPNGIPIRCNYNLKDCVCVTLFPLADWWPPSPMKGYWHSPAAAAATPARFLAAIHESPWRGALEPAPECITPRACRVVQGAVPETLRGTLYRNGAGRLRIGNAQYAHWFDGDGYVVSVTSAAPTTRRSSELAMCARAGWSSKTDGTHRIVGDLRAVAVGRSVRTGACGGTDVGCRRIRPIRTRSSSAAASSRSVKAVCVSSGWSL